MGRRYSPVCCASARASLLEIGAQGDGFAEKLVALAGVAGDDAQRQLDHVRRLQLGRGDVVQHVGRMLHPRGRGGELDDAGGHDVAQGGEREIGAGVVGLVHDDDGPAQPQHVHQGGLGFAVGAGQQVGEAFGGHVQQMLGEGAVLVVDLAAGGVLDAEGLDGGDDDHGLPFDRGAREAERFLDGDDFDRAARQLQGAAVGMARVAQRVGGLVEDGVAGDEPEHHAALGVEQIGHGQAGRVAGEQRLAAAGGHAQADVGHPMRQSCHRHREVGHGRLAVAKLDGLERRLGPALPRALAEEVPQRIEHAHLVVFEDDHDTLIS